MNHISATELKEKLAAGEPVFLLDVREDFEHEDFNIGGTHIPLGEVLTKQQDIPQDQPVVVYCRKGIRSQIAIQKLQEKFGYENLVNLSGGIEKLKGSWH
jgi:adenylyltransferase/sulfurtransferase